MPKLEELKLVCEEKKEKAIELNKTFCSKLISKDLDNLLDNYPNIIKQSNNTYFFNNFIIASNEDILTIEDRNNEPFLWGFEIIHNKIMRLSDVFKYNGKIMGVSYIKQYDNVEISEITNVIHELDETISVLSSNIPLDTWKYKYYDYHEQLICESIEDVFRTVIKVNL